MYYNNPQGESRSIAESDAAWLIKYFQDEHWILGIQIVQEWMRLLTMSSIPQVELEALLLRIGVHKYDGAGWYDLALRVNRWIINQDIPITRLFPHPLSDQ